MIIIHNAALSMGECGIGGWDGADIAHATQWGLTNWKNVSYTIRTHTLFFKPLT